MQSFTYQDIIDDKIAEWGSSLKKLEEQAERATPKIKSQLNAKAEQLKALIDMATVQLRNLDEQETVDNTMETKDKILQIFSSIDKDCIGYEKKTPFML